MVFDVFPSGPPRGFGTAHAAPVRTAGFLACPCPVRLPVRPVSGRQWPMWTDNNGTYSSGTARDLHPFPLSVSATKLKYLS